MKDPNLSLSWEISCLDCGSVPFLPCCEPSEIREIFPVDILVLSGIDAIRYLNKSSEELAEDDRFWETF